MLKLLIFHLQMFYQAVLIGLRAGIKHNNHTGWK